MFAPFSGLLFDPRRVPDTASVTCPPYDVIDERARRRFLEASPYNVVRLLLAERDDARYQEPARLLAEWRSEEVLRLDDAPRFYLYQLEWRGPDGRARSARGVVGALALAPDRHPILPHEETIERVRSDRLAALRATRANLDPIVVLSPAEDLDELLEPSGEPRVEVSDERVEHRLHDLTDPDRQRAIREAVTRHPVMIADGHHRFATALRYREERRRREGPGPWDAIMAFLSPVSDGLSVGTFHRVFSAARLDPDRLEERFEVIRGAPADPPADPGALVVVPGSAHRRPPSLLRPRSEALQALPGPWRVASAAVARELLYPLLEVEEEGAAYEPDPATALELLDDSPRGVAILTAPIPEEAITTALEEGVRFPQKSTFFHPKPRAGLVLRPLDPLTRSAP